MNKSLLISLLFLVVASFAGSLRAQVQTGTISSLKKNTSTNSSTYTPGRLYDDDSENPDSTVDNTPQGIIYDTGTLPDSVMCSHIFSFSQNVRAVKIRQLQNPSFLPTGLQCNDPLAGVEQPLFTSLGALGQVHTPLFVPTTINTSLFAPDPLPYFRQALHSMRMFQTQNPYTLLGYGSSLNKDYQIRVVHTQNIRPRLNFAMLYDLVSREGLYTNSGLTDHFIDLTTNYYSEDARYQLQAALTYNRLRHQENGGVTNDTTCWDYSRESGVPVNMYSAQNQWRDIELHIHQSFNTVRQFDLVREHTVIDTLPPDPSAPQNPDSTAMPEIQTKEYSFFDTTAAPSPSTFNSGVFALDMAYARHRRIFTDNAATSWFYDYGSIDTSFFFDSTAHHQLYAEIYWTNDAYMHHRYPNPLIITGGIRPQFDLIRFATPDNKTSEVNLTPFASARIRIKRMLLEANAEETNGTHRFGDYRLDGKLSLLTNAGNISVSATSEAQSPNLIFYHNEGVYNWDISSYKKTKLQRLSLAYDFNPDSQTPPVLPLSHSVTAPLNRGADRWPQAVGVGQESDPEPARQSGSKKSFFQIQSTKASVSTTLLSDNIWFDSLMRPTQGNATALLLQADLCGHFQLRWLNLRTHLLMQNSSNDDVIRLPRFATKNSLFADFELFKGAMQTQVGVDVRYHTSFYADAWNPVLGAFYRQDKVKVGDYLIADLWITLQVKRATIYLRASHLNEPLEELAGLQPAYFSLPHYPYEKFSLYWGMIWRFFD